MNPVLLADVPDAARIRSEEIFGPVTCLERFEDEGEAIAVRQLRALRPGGGSLHGKRRAGAAPPARTQGRQRLDQLLQDARPRPPLRRRQGKRDRARVRNRRRPQLREAEGPRGRLPHLTRTTGTRRLPAGTQSPSANEGKPSMNAHRPHAGHRRDHRRRCGRRVAGGDRRRGRGGRADRHRRSGQGDPQRSPRPRTGVLVRQLVDIEQTVRSGDPLAEIDEG